MVTWCPIKIWARSVQPFWRFEFIYRYSWVPSFALKQSFLNKSQPIQLRTSNLATHNPVVLQSSQIKICSKSVKGFLSYDRTYKLSKCLIFCKLGKGGGVSPIFLFGLGLGLEYIPAVLYLLHRSTNTYKGKTSTCLNYLKKKNKEYNEYEAREGRKGGRVRE